MQVLTICAINHIVRYDSNEFLGTDVFSLHCANASHKNKIIAIVVTTPLKRKTVCILYVRPALCYERIKTAS